MRLPVSTCCEQEASGGVFVGVVRCAVLPRAPEDSEPGSGEDANGMRVSASSLSGVLIELRSPGAGMPGIVCEAGERSAQSLVAGPSPCDGAGFTTLVGDWCDAGLGSQVFLALEAVAHIAQLGGDLCRADLSGARKGHDDLSFGQFGNGMLDAAGKLADLGDEAFEGGGDGAHELALGVGFSFSGHCGGSSAQPSEHIGNAAPATILVLGKEGSHALLTQAVGAFGCGIALEEGQCDRACDVGEQTGGARPEAFEQGSQLVGEHESCGDEIVTAAHQRAQRLDGIGLGPERGQPVPVGAQDVGKDVGIARIALGGNGAIARPACLDDIGMDRRDDEAGVDQRVDEQPAGPFDGDRRLAGWPMPAQTRDEIGKPIAIMGHDKMVEDLTGSVDDTDGMARTAPVEPDENGHGCTSLNWSMVPGAGSPHGLLINRRSGPILAEVSVAHLPVARLWLSATETPQVSCGPSSGKRHRRSSRWRGTNAQSALKLIQRNREVA